MMISENTEMLHNICYALGEIRDEIKLAREAKELSFLNETPQSRAIKTIQKKIWDENYRYRLEVEE